MSPTMTSTLVILALTMASGASMPADSDDQSTDAIFPSMSPNEVDYEGTSKFARAHSAVSSSEESYERDTSGESEREAPRISTAKDEMYARSAKKGRRHKAFFLNYPYVPQVQRYQKPTSYETRLKNRKNDSAEKRKPGHKKKLQQESQIYYIRLPPTPYMYVPGLGYISQPPTYSTAGLQRPSISHAQRPSKPQQNVYHKPGINPFINVPIDFVSNGKPTGVYQWPGSKRPDSALNSLKKGPYVFNGKPTSLYLLTADGRQTGHQPIRLADYSSNGYY